MVGERAGAVSPEATWSSHQLAKPPTAARPAPPPIIIQPSGAAGVKLMPMPAIDVRTPATPTPAMSSLVLLE